MPFLFLFLTLDFFCFLGGVEGTVFQLFLTHSTVAASSGRELLHTSRALGFAAAAQGMPTCLWRSEQQTTTPGHCSHRLKHNRSLSEEEAALRVLELALRARPHFCLPLPNYLNIPELTTLSFYLSFSDFKGFIK